MTNRYPRSFSPVDDGPERLPGLSRDAYMGWSRMIEPGLVCSAASLGDLLCGGCAFGVRFHVPHDRRAVVFLQVVRQGEELLAVGRAEVDVSGSRSCGSARRCPRSPSPRCPAARRPCARALYVWLPISCPASAICLPSSGCFSRSRPIRKNVAGTFSAQKVQDFLGAGGIGAVVEGQGHELLVGLDAVDQITEELERARAGDVPQRGGGDEHEGEADRRDDRRLAAQPLHALTMTSGGPMRSTPSSSGTHRIPPLPRNALNAPGAMTGIHPGAGIRRPMHLEPHRPVPAVQAEHRAARQRVHVEPAHDDVPARHQRVHRPRFERLRRDERDGGVAVRGMVEVPVTDDAEPGPNHDVVARNRLRIGTRAVRRTALESVHG